MTVADTNIIRIDLRRAIRFAHSFVCTGCAMEVFAAVHYGRADMCLMCQEVGPEMSRWLNGRFEKQNI